LKGDYMKKGISHKGLGTVAKVAGVASVVAAIGAAVVVLSNQKRRERALMMLENAKGHGENFLKSVGEVLEHIREEAPEKVEELQKSFSNAQKSLRKKLT